MQIASIAGRGGPAPSGFAARFTVADTGTIACQDATHICAVRSVRPFSITV